MSLARLRAAASRSRLEAAAWRPDYKVGTVSFHFLVFFKKVDEMWRTVLSFEQCIVFLTLFHFNSFCRLPPCNLMMSGQQVEIALCLVNPGLFLFQAEPSGEGNRRWAEWD